MGNVKWELGACKKSIKKKSYLDCGSKKFFGHCQSSYNVYKVGLEGYFDSSPSRGSRCNTAKVKVA
jgi:hypothetical protein